MKLQKKPAGARAFSLLRIFKKGPGNEVGCNCDLQPINSVCLVDITPQYSIVDCEKWTMGQR